MAITRDAVALRVTMMMGHTGRYLETKRADSPLQDHQHLLQAQLQTEIIPRGQDQDSPSIQFMARGYCSHGN